MPLGNPNVSDVAQMPRASGDRKISLPVTTGAAPPVSTSRRFCGGNVIALIAIARTVRPEIQLQQSRDDLMQIAPVTHGDPGLTAPMTWRIPLAKLKWN
jgi:hypothetical protein